MGIITGITMEFQFGTNWSEYSKYMGDIFGSPLAIEALVAFFLESTFMGIWLFGKDKISPKFRAFCMWMVALGTNISALWIITANGFMQNPVGYVVRNGRAELNDFGTRYESIRLEYVLPYCSWLLYCWCFLRYGN